MIALLRGTLHSRHDDKIVLLVRGVGYEITCTRTALEQLERVSGEVDLHVITSVTDHSIDLYGFADENEKLLYTKLVSVSGIGPKAAIALLGKFGARALVGYLYSENQKAITKAPGIGKKSAQRLVLELSGQMEPFRNRFSRPIETVTGLSKRSGLVERAVSALSHLGYRPGELENIAMELERAATKGRDLQELVRLGLSLLRKE